MHDTVELIFDRDLSQLLSNLRVDKHYECTIQMKAEALKADLFEQIVQMK